MSGKAPPVKWPDPLDTHMI